MKLSMSQTPQLLIECDCCDGHIEDHDADCPRHALRELGQKRTCYPCPCCHKTGKVELNMDDLLECRSCRVVLSRGLVPGHDPTKVFYKHIIDLNRDEVFKVAVVPNVRGRGQFPYDIVVQALFKLVEERVAAKAARRTHEE